MARPRTVSEAEQEFLRGHFDNAATLYRAELQKTPDDPVATIGLTQVLLKQQKIVEADALIGAAAAKNKNSAALLTSLGEVQYREGMPWLASQSVAAAEKLDPCNARTHLLTARISRLSSYYASAAKELSTAHALDPHDPVIRSMWMNTLPLAAQITELEGSSPATTGKTKKN